jgi:hypothetical protein
MAIELTTATNEQISGIQDALNLDTPILTEYPTTDATKVGQKFIYKGNEWKYHSQAELDDLGWSTVSEGFPAPVNKVINLQILYSDLSFYSLDVLNLGLTSTSQPDSGPFQSYTLDFIGLGDPSKYGRFTNIRILNAGPQNTVSGIKNANLLYGLKDIGTTPCLAFGGSNITDTVLDDFFTQLPPTSRVVTIDVSGNTGSATCDPTIATAKGYIVVT